MPDAADILLIGASTAGDFSPYTLRLVNSATQAQEDPSKSPRCSPASIRNSPRSSSPSRSNALRSSTASRLAPDCPPDLPAPPPINYLAKDYGSFRTVMLDRLNQLLPAWGRIERSRHGHRAGRAASPTCGDPLSYKQDAVATEAYLQTARSRISLRRHALLVDYHVHDGCNARAWMQLQVDSPVDFLDRHDRFYTYRCRACQPRSLGNEQRCAGCGRGRLRADAGRAPLPRHNQMSFYTWGDEQLLSAEGRDRSDAARHLSQSAGRATCSSFRRSSARRPGIAADADMRHRCAVRLTNVTTQDAAGNPLVDPLFEKGTGKAITSPAQTPTPVTEIQWSADDALPFPVCISSKYLDSQQKEQTIPNVSKVFGNVVLADHGCHVERTLI